MTAPTVSILMPTYNRADLLSDALHSALAQTYSDVEIVVLDNCSPDRTSEVVAKVAGGDARVRYVRHSENLGMTGNWRAGILACQGRFFCLLHDDDILEPTFVEKTAVPLLADETLVLAFTDHWNMDAQGTGWLQRPRPRSDAHRDVLPGGRLQDFARVALVDHAVPVGATLFRRSAVRPEFIAEEARGGSDMWLLYQCVKTGGGAYYVPERLMNYREHGGGMSGSQPLYMGEGHLFRYGHILADPDMKSIHADIRQARAETLLCYGIDLMNLGRVSEARKALRASLKDRKNRRALIAYGIACGGPIGPTMTGLIRRIKRARAGHVQTTA